MKTKFYEARLLDGMVERTIVIEALTIQMAYRAAVEQCVEGEFVRGVTPADETIGWTWGEAATIDGAEEVLR
jgi:hypothetical protein